jgi:RimJ/RimL family protein N-acetyltransferase
MHCAGFVPRWMNRNLLGMAFHYPFVQLGCAKVFLQVSTGNTAALKFAAGLGFRHVATLEDAFVDGHCAVLEMKKADCRWLDMGVYINILPAEGRQ